MEILPNQMKNMLRRSQKRYELSISLGVDGKDVTGRVFTTTAMLCNVSPDGGCMVIDRGVACGQMIRISNLQGEVFPARVCWATYSYRTKQRHMGFKLEGGKNHGFLMASVGRETQTVSV
jgi:hypothetical protein